jgi:hypothetical protein
VSREEEDPRLEQREEDWRQVSRKEENWLFMCRGGGRLEAGEQREGRQEVASREVED